MHFLEQIPAPTYLITGEPGAGKSYAIQTIVELASILQLGITASTSYNGIAAVNVDMAVLFVLHFPSSTQVNQANISPKMLSGAFNSSSTLKNYAVCL